jgi:peptide/nickel transport system ATP-binding protein
MVFQGAMNSFNPTMKIKDHFVETIRAHSEDEGERMAYARELMRDLYLNPDRVLESYPHELSGGMKQRALIALAMLLEPEVLIMDEPTSALDMLMQRTIISMMEELKETHDLTVVFITHDMPIVSGLADRISVMYAFEIVEVGSTEGVILDANHPYTRALLRSVPDADMPIDQLEVVEGRGPDPVNVPTGCSYHPRCPLADDRCEIEDPELVEVEDDHWAACFYWDQADDAVPYEIHRQEWEADE